MTSDIASDVLISVVIPTYNRGEAILKTIESALHQDLPSDQFEIIIIDDGSTDNTWQILQSAYQNQACVRLFSISNGGVAQARNRGLSEAQGEFIAYLDHDDLWLPAKLRRQLEVARQFPDAAVIYSLWRDVDEAGVPLPAEYWNTNFRHWTPRTGRVYDWVCSMPCPIVSMSVPLLNAYILRKIGGFEPATVPCDDWDLWLRLSRQHDFQMVPEELVHYVHHGQQQSSDLASIHGGMRRTLARQWPFVLRRPNRWWFVWSFYRFLATSSLYDEAKTHLFARRSQDVSLVMLRVAFTSPLSLFSPQWLYLLRRLITRNFRAY